jgi:hypothetical protein
MPFPLQFVSIVVRMLLTSALATTSRSWSPLMSVDGEIVCAVPPGLLKTYQCPSLVKCANDCQRSSSCGGFNTRENGSCEHYGRNQTQFGLQQGCRYFTVSLNICWRLFWLALKIQVHLIYLLLLALRQVLR